MKKLKVIYVAGSGRTGSTLLAMVLAKAQGGFNVGQLRDLTYALLQKESCSCGALVSECPIWSKVARANGLTEEAAVKEADSCLKQFTKAFRIEEWRTDPSIIWERHGSYLEMLRGLYLATAEATGADVLIDSSKSPEIASAASVLPEIDLRVVHVSRDPRAVACSWEKRHKDRAKTLHFCDVWLQRERILKQWRKENWGPITRVKYEDFAARPRPVMEKLFRWAELEEPVGLFESDRVTRMDWSKLHLFPRVNEGVLTRREEMVAIRPAVEWKKSELKELHAAALERTGPEGRRYSVSGLLRWPWN